MTFIDVFIRHRFARKSRFVYLQIRGLKKKAVGRHLIAHLYHHNIAYGHFTTCYLTHFTVTNNLYRLFLAYSREYIKLTCCVALKKETYCSGKKDGKKDTHSFDKFPVYKSQCQRHGCSYKQNTYNGIVVLFNIK